MLHSPNDSVLQKQLRRSSEAPNSLLIAPSRTTSPSRCCGVPSFLSPTLTHEQELTPFPSQCRQTMLHSTLSPSANPHAGQGLRNSQELLAHLALQGSHGPLGNHDSLDDHGPHDHRETRLPLSLLQHIPASTTPHMVGKTDQQLLRGALVLPHHPSFLQKRRRRSLTSCQLMMMMMIMMPLAGGMKKPSMTLLCGFKTGNTPWRAPGGGRGEGGKGGWGCSRKFVTLGTMLSYFMRHVAFKSSYIQSSSAFSPSPFTISHLSPRHHLSTIFQAT